MDGWMGITKSTFHPECDMNIYNMAPEAVLHKAINVNLLLVSRLIWRVNWTVSAAAVSLTQTARAHTSITDEQVTET